MNAAEAISQAHTALTEAAAALDALETMLMVQPDDPPIHGFGLVQLIGPAISSRIRCALASLECCTPGPMR